MQADDLILFSQVVELGSFSKAAEINQVSNSVVSKRIARLEAELGVQLLYRTTRKLTVTEAGRLLTQGAKNVNQAAIEAFASVSNLETCITGHIKMSVPTISGDLLLAEAVAEFCQLHQGLTVDMSLDNRFVDLIEEGYDLVIRTGHLTDSSLIARHIIDSQWVVCASTSYLQNHPSPKTPKDLLQHNCLKYAYQSSGANEWAFKDGQHTYSIRVNGSFSTNNAAALRKAVLAGYGIAYLPRCLVHEDLRDHKLSLLFPSQVAKKQGVYAVYPNTKHLPLKTKTLIEHIKNKYQRLAHYFN
ncbi:LysR family transcriptional regulator [Gayadomonas joobiniege]|uniref:LysR family transcriptional regulator n=1 Tax=Gayadomonas joobiniege TaxID=1234606 RepID=UPI000377A003|nr:LysR family transcriptional regulator [Gayadomonas joobiniege]